MCTKIYISAWIRQEVGRVELNARLIAVDLQESARCWMNSSA